MIRLRRAGLHVSHDRWLMLSVILCLCPGRAFTAGELEYLTGIHSSTIEAMQKNAIEKLRRAAQRLKN